MKNSYISNNMMDNGVTDCKNCSFSCKNPSMKYMLNKLNNCIWVLYFSSFIFAVRKTFENQGQ